MAYSLVPFLFVLFCFSFLLFYFILIKLINFYYFFSPKFMTFFLSIFRALQPYKMYFNYGI